MTLITKIKNGLEFNDSCIHEKQIIEKYISAIREHGFDTLLITWGVDPSPDFGYFDLASRYWRASLCIYMSGGVHCFWERGVGFTEPWLFNARHSFELTLKGLKLFSEWLKAVNENIRTTGYVSSIVALKKIFSKLHSLSSLYADFKDSIQQAIQGWNSEIFQQAPSLKELVLSPHSEKILTELNEIDPNSFSFRYPSLKNGQTDEIQRLNCKPQPVELLPKTGLPKESGYFFDHIKTVNSVHDLNSELSKIVNLCNSIWDFVGDMQDYIQEGMSEF